MTTEITLFENITKEKAVEIYTGNDLDNYLKEIETDANNFVADIETVEGRGQIASKAFEISKKKVALDGFGKDLVAEWKQNSKLVDASRKKTREFLDELKNKIREPLTLWEDEEKKRIEKEKIDLEISIAFEEALAENDLFEREKVIELKEKEEKRLEIIRIDQEKKEKIERERQQKIDQEKRDSELKARITKQAEEKRKRDLAFAKLTAEKEKQDAILRERRYAEQKERERIEDEQIEKEKAEKKANNLRHQKRINNEALEDLIKLNIKEEHAKIMILAIKDNKVRNITINY